MNIELVELDRIDIHRGTQARVKLDEATVAEYAEMMREGVEFGIAKQFFRAAVKRRLLADNPFQELKSGCQVNETRDYFVTRAEAEKVLAACPDLKWRLIFALSRYGGLRCPSEHAALRWSDIDLVRGRMVVRSPKTEHHAGGASREMPLSPELRPYLEAARRLAPTDAEYVLQFRQGNKGEPSHASAKDH